MYFAGLRVDKHCSEDRWNLLRIPKYFNNIFLNTQIFSIFLKQSLILIFHEVKETCSCYRLSDFRVCLWLLQGQMKPKGADGMKMGSSEGQRMGGPQQGQFNSEEDDDDDESGSDDSEDDDDDDDEEDDDHVAVEG